MIRTYAADCICTATDCHRDLQLSWRQKLLLPKTADWAAEADAAAAALTAGCCMI